MTLNWNEFQDDCAHLDAKDLWDWNNEQIEYSCKWRVHSSCPKNCEAYLKETVIGILQK